MAATTTQLNPATVDGGSKIAGDSLDTINGAAAPTGAVAHYAKLAHGAAGELKDVTPAQPVPTADQNLPALIGALDVAPAGSDTANAPTNGLLKRLAQRLTAAIDALGTKVSAVAALGAGGVGVIGWLSQVWDVLQSRLPNLVSGRVPVDGSGVTQPVSGPLTDVQLRAAAVPVSASALPLPSGASTSALQTAANSSLSSIDGKLPAALIAGRLASEPLGELGVSRTVAAGTSSATVALTTTCRRVSLTAYGCDVRYEIATGTPTAHNVTSHLLVAGATKDWAVPANAVVAAIRASGATVNGSLEIDEII